ncbi:MAG: hypothetical protein ACREN1_01840, partial [Candidatus Dormibacteria bacterium]
LFSAFMLGTPLVNGDLALPESFLIALTVWGMVAVLAGLRARSTVPALWLAVAAGLLLGLACLIQQTALADAVAALLVLLTAGGRGVRLGLAAGLSLGVTIAAVLAPFVVAAGAHRVFFFLVTSFAGYAQPALGGGLLLVLPRVAAAVLLLAGVWATRGWPDKRRLSWVWLGCVVLVYVLPNRPYAHFLLPAIPALALVLARLPRVHPRLLLHRVERAGRPLVASVAVSGLLWAGVVAGGFTGGSLFTAKLTGEYYPVFVGRALGLVSPANYVSTYGAVPLAERSAVAWMRAHRAANRTAVVWSPDSWAYLLARLKPVLPAPPIYVDQEWLGTRRLLRRVTARQPALILVTPGALTAYGPIAGVLHADYTRVAGIQPGQLWVRANVARRISRTRDATRGAGAGVAARGRPPTRRSA